MARQELVPAIPNRLDDWTLEVVNRLTAMGEGESDRHDFKADIPKGGGLSDVVSAFSNTRGGFLVFGVGEVKKAWRVIGLDPDKEFGPRLWDRVRVDPTPTLSNPKAIPINEDSVLYVVHVARGQQRPYVPLTSSPLKFLKRIGGKNEHMTLEEIRSQFSDTDRQMLGLRIMYQEMLHNATVLRTYYFAQGRELNWQRFDTSALDSAVANSFALISEHPQFVEAVFGLRRQLLQFNREREYYAQRAAVSALTAAIIEEDKQRASGSLFSIREQMKSIGAMLEAFYGIEHAQAAFRNI